MIDIGVCEERVQDAYRFDGVFVVGKEALN